MYSRSYSPFVLKYAVEGLNTARMTAAEMEARPDICIYVQKIGRSCYLKWLRKVYCAVLSVLREVPWDIYARRIERQTLPMALDTTAKVRKVTHTPR